MRAVILGRPMRRVFWSAAAVFWIGLTLTLPAGAQTQQLIDVCGNQSKTSSPDQRIEGCTALIEGARVFGMWRSWAWENLCSAYNDKRESDRAIAYCNQAIEFDPTAAAYDSRGRAYFEKGDGGHAIADYSEAIKLNPKDAVGLNNRARVYYLKGDFALAIGDYDQAIRLDPNDASAYQGRALAHFYAGALAEALADFDRSRALDPQNAYPVLWMEIVAKRSHSASQLAKSAALLDMMKWPAPVVRLFLGKMTPQALLVAADDPDPFAKKGRTCEANFYGGEWDLERGKKDEAARLLAAAAADCPRSFFEYGAANAELKALRALQ